LVKLKGFQKLTSTDEALQVWLSKLGLKKPKQETVSIHEAFSRVLAEDLVAKDNLPWFDKSAMDGYALKAEFTVGASQFKPAHFRLTKEEIKSKEARQIWTGNEVPAGADAVIMLENTELKGEDLMVWNPLAPGDNVSKKGEDVKKGETVVKAGTRLNAYHVALAAALGYIQLKVAVKPKIAILATGNELTEIGSKPVGNQIFDSNKIMVACMCKELGAEPVDMGLAKDNIEEIVQKIQKALETTDAVITTGGTSVGGLDLVPDAVNKIGKPGVVVHGVALKPAMPTGVAILKEKPVMILSGNPVAAIIGFEVFARPLISALLGMQKTQLRPALKAIMTKRVTTTLGRKNYVRVKVTVKDCEFVAEPVSAKGSGAISTMTKGNGFVVVAENREGLSEGEPVTVYLYAPVEA
jgi:molybdopterin molybdotransferase